MTSQKRLLARPTKRRCEICSLYGGCLGSYEQPYDSASEILVVCVDEKPYQLLGESRELLPMRADAERVVFVMDHLNTYKVASMYKK